MGLTKRTFPCFVDVWGIEKVNLREEREIMIPSELFYDYACGSYEDWKSILSIYILPVMLFALGLQNILCNKKPLIEENDCKFVIILRLILT